MTQFHPPAEMLMDYATGALKEAPSLLIATHLSLCPGCRAEVAKHEQIGGELLENCEAIAVSASCKDKVLAALEVYERQTEAERPLDLFKCRTLPAPLRGYVGCGASEVPWQKLTSTIDIFHFPIACEGGKARLMRIKAGTAMPRHTHKGMEYMLVLAGSYHDESGQYKRGDVAVSDSSITHRPVADDAQDCICLIVLDGEMHMPGFLSRIMSPFVRL